MSISNELFWQASLEGQSEGWQDQPVVAVYIPERDGEISPLVNMDVKDATVHYRTWYGLPGMEGMQQMHHHMEEQEKLVELQQEEEELREKIHDDYSLFVLHPEVDPQWYEVLGEVKELTGVLLSGQLSEYRVGQVEALQDRMGMESVFTDVGKACLHIERTLHRRKQVAAV